MCRHLPRFNLPVSQVLHDVGRLVSAHPLATVAVLLAPACAVALVLACRHLLRRMPGGWHVGRVWIPAIPPRVPEGGFGAAPSR